MANPSSLGTLACWLRCLGASALVLALTGCDDAEHQKALEKVRREADERVAQLEAKSKERVAALEKEVQTLKSEVDAAASKAKAAAEEAATKAQADLDDAEKETEKALVRAREAYKSEARARYAALNKDLAAITAKASKVPPKGKAAYDKVIKDIVALQKELKKDIAGYDEATLDTFGKTKAKLDQDLAKYKAYIRLAKTKVPA